MSGPDELEALVKRLERHGCYWTVGDDASEERARDADKAAAAIAALRAEVERLKLERDEIKDDYLSRHKVACDRFETIVILQAQLEAAEAREGKLRAALEIAERFLDRATPSDGVYQAHQIVAAALEDKP